jgi:signal peptidase complex subunit 1
LRKAIKRRKEQEIAIKMDYQGQKLSENLFYYIILLFGSVGWIYGYILQDFTYVFYSWSVGVGISLVLCVPDWPIYNKHPIKWLESIPDRSDDSDSDEEEEETKKSK